MKKKLIALLCAMLIGCGALAESPEATPAPEVSETVQPGGSMSVTLNGQPLTLDFDPDPTYSICRDGYVQASFFAYGEGDLLYELYVTFPQDVQSGDVVSPSTRMLAADIYSGVFLYISDSDTDLCSAATQYLTGEYPENSDYALTFSEVSYSGTVASFAGSLTAKLVEVDQNFNATNTVNDFSATFSFSMDLGSELSEPETREPEASSEPGAEVPETESPSDQYPPAAPSKLVTPSNARKI